uniref:Relaxin family peptide receptor 3.3a2 n=1 Tax=Eptatretus burgeri TaxID=7764 RepID=A0A8C4QV86_EPTBU
PPWSPALRIIISLVYSIVCAVGLVGNLFVFYVMHSKQARKKSTINFYVLNLAVTDFQFVLVLPFWAVETGLDFNWPFGDAICRIVSSLTLLNMYASVSFLTAMSVARYWAIASGLQARSRPAIFTPSWASVFIWLTACAASIPTAVFSTVVHVSGVSLCITKFPEGEEFWLSVYNIQKIVLGFLLPLLIISICYQLLLRFLREKNPVGAKKPGRRLQGDPLHHCCGAVILFVPFSNMYYTTQEYVYPVTLCLAHSNSCLNPLLYCLLRKDIRQSLRQLLWHQATSPKSRGYSNTDA